MPPKYDQPGLHISVTNQQALVYFTSRDHYHTSPATELYLSKRASENDHYDAAYPIQPFRPNSKLVKNVCSQLMGLFLDNLVFRDFRLSSSHSLLWENERPWERGWFRESPDNFSGPKSQLSSCNPLVLKS